MQVEKHHKDRVSRETWETAQTWERDHWVREQKSLSEYGKNYIWRLLSLVGLVDKYRGDDRNHWWLNAFSGYKFLPSQVKNALEVGCGPYTNMRLIKNVCRCDHLYISDPLIRTYVKFKRTYVRQMYDEVSCCIDDHPLEELPFADCYFDLAIMINVLDHVRDANACMENLIRVTRKRGFVLIGQDLTNSEDLKRQPAGLRVGHPIVLNETWFNVWLENRFEIVLRKVLPTEMGWAPQWHYGTLVFA